jgi:hypothetical protein
MMTSWDVRGTGLWTRLMQTLVCSWNRMFRCAGSTDSSPLVPGFITPGELKPFLHSGLPQPTFFPLITSHLPVGKFLQLSQFITRLWKFKLTPWSLSPPRVHVLLRGLCGGKEGVTLLAPRAEICFFSFYGTVDPKTPIRHPSRMVWVVKPYHPSSVAYGRRRCQGNRQRKRTRRGCCNRQVEEAASSAADKLRKVS